MSDKPNPDMLIQSQQVTLTGPMQYVRLLLKQMTIQAEYLDCTVTIDRPSVTDATVGVTRESQQNPQQWISVEDRLPELNVVFDVPKQGNPDERFQFRSSSWVLIAVFNHDEDRYFVDTGIYCPEKGGWEQPGPKKFVTGEPWHEVTHWMPLPEPPDAQGSVTEQPQQKSRQDGEA